MSAAVGPAVMLFSRRAFGQNRLVPVAAQGV